MSNPRAGHSCEFFKGKVFVVRSEADSSETYDPELNIWSVGPKFPNNQHVNTGSMEVFHDNLYFKEYYSGDGQHIFQLEMSSSLAVPLKWRPATHLQSNTRDDIFPLTKLVLAQYSPGPAYCVLDKTT